MEADRAQELLGRERERIELALRGLGPQESGEPSGDDHLGDQASELYDAELGEGRAEDLRTALAAVERAERRLLDGTYGISIESGEPIPDARLELAPAAERTVAEQARFDDGG